LIRNVSECVYRFGPFALDLVGGRLTRDGRELRLRPKAFEVLQLLVENPARLVAKDELLEAVWPGRFVSDDSLTQTLSDIRQALGDEAGMIVTVPKRGYRLDAAVCRDPAETIEPIAAGPFAETRYALSGDLRIAYQVIGNGPVDLVCIPGWVTHLEYGWEEPSLARFYRRLASFARLILFDKRGTGLSDRDSGLPNIQQRMDDVRAVMDAVGSKRAVLFGMSEGCGMAMSFAATFPERTQALILWGAFAKREWSPDYPWAPTAAKRQIFYNAIERDWGGPVGVDDIAPSRAGDPDFRHWWATYQRRSASPAAALALAHMNTRIDTRHILPSIRAPTLVMHRRDDRDALVEEGRFIAECIPGAKLVEFEGADHLYFVGEQDEVLDCAAAFISEHGAEREGDNESGAFRSPDLYGGA
jgi:DNA-binding winged helix-turn-helix (wHTH) protein/pimeloyl-ACP methyl ester carboxylesterase